MVCAGVPILFVVAKSKLIPADRKKISEKEKRAAFRRTPSEAERKTKERKKEVEKNNRTLGTATPSSRRRLLDKSACHDFLA